MRAASWRLAQALLPRRVASKVLLLAQLSKINWRSKCAPWQFQSRQFITLACLVSLLVGTLVRLESSFYPCTPTIYVSHINCTVRSFLILSLDGYGYTHSPFLIAPNMFSISGVRESLGALSRTRNAAHHTDLAGCLRYLGMIPMNKSGQYLPPNSNP